MILKMQSILIFKIYQSQMQSSVNLSALSHLDGFKLIVLFALNSLQDQDHLSPITVQTFE